MDNSKNVLLINDMPGYGNVALAAMVPILSHMGFHTLAVPSAVISNTLNYGDFKLTDMTDYMSGSIAAYERLGFRYRAVSTGFITSSEQAKLLIEICKKERANGTLVFSDPIMGDNGKLYNSITPERVDMLRALTCYADYIVPNYTEAVYLAGKEYQAEGLTIDDTHELIDSLRKLGAKSVVITSMLIKADDAPLQYVAGYDAILGKYFELQVDLLPGWFPGTGDIFLSIMMGHVLKGLSLQESVQKSMSSVHDLIMACRDTQEEFPGIRLEENLNLIS